MTEIQAIQARHTVRRYLDQPISDDIKGALREKLQKFNQQYVLRMQLVTENTDAFGGVLKLVLAKGVQNFIVLAGKDSPDTDEKLGYCGIQAALLAQRLGLNSWWVAGTYHKSRVAQMVKLTPDEKITGIIVVGYGAKQGTPHKSKRADEVSSYEGTAPDWFIQGVNAALLAPTALNKQNFTIAGKGETVSITAPESAFARTDLGIVKYHFEVGAGTDNFKWA